MLNDLNKGDNMSEKMKSIEFAGTELMKKINAFSSAGTVIGIDQVGIVVDDLYGICELTENYFEHKPVTLSQILGVILPIAAPVVFAIVPAGTVATLLKTVLAAFGVSGQSIDFAIVKNQALDLTDGELASLVSKGDSHQLGENAPKYKQVVKLLLTIIQTYSVFEPDVPATPDSGSTN